MGRQASKFKQAWFAPTSCFTFTSFSWHFAEQQVNKLKQTSFVSALCFAFTSFSWHFVGRQASKFKQAWFAPTSCFLLLAVASALRWPTGYNDCASAKARGLKFISNHQRVALARVFAEARLERSDSSSTSLFSFVLCFLLNLFLSIYISLLSFYCSYKIAKIKIYKICHRYFKFYWKIFLFII